MLKRTIAAAAVGLASVLATAAPASAIRYGEPDRGEHPSVGMMYAYTSWDSDGDGTPDQLVASWRCTGTQMNADTFVTAGHCTYGAEAVAIWYEDDLTDLPPDTAFYEGATKSADAYARGGDNILTHPQFDPSAFYLHDLGIVKLEKTHPLDPTKYGELPRENYWDAQIALTKKKRDAYTTVGYGLQWATPSRGKSTPNPNARQSEAQPIKLQAHGELIGRGGKNSDTYVLLTNNANTGGTCFGDSGGPTFISGTTTVVAVTSSGKKNPTCAGPNGMYRIDTADDLAWIAEVIG